MSPQRIQRKRVKGFRLPPNTVCVTRPGPLGNPWLITADDSGERSGWWVRHRTANGVGGAFFPTMEQARRVSVEAFRISTVLGIPVEQLARIAAADYVACYCDPDDGMACHGDVLIAAAVRS